MAEITVEIDNERNCAYWFFPLERKLRGRFDYARCPEPYAAQVARTHPQGIPGQAVKVDTTRRKATVVDLLADDKATVAALKARNLQARAHESEEHKLSDDGLATWLYWLRRGVDLGVCKVTKGKLPSFEEIEAIGTPKTDYGPQAPPNPIDRLATAFEKLADRLAPAVPAGR